ncbi:CinA family protein [Novosphingobium sp. BK352]|uniref:CinA family protein n=1 Tax=unclassified Novosphingobium TaxID=2644732 RepID=UPI001823843D|nr:nicotinamide-nucleotide amidase [Novosphingobium sp. BK267]MBB3447905.1 nicotinamide-nucleotide amidase [Novosphingobium sp. BK352]MBB3477312.1 nicotinamide-nucleotide amidase [Novosphingobium sp. BK369]MBB3536402.1 nicotinamide-nucleotide amidase [Novosphingobium sp. BK486]MBB3555437.1 nicotinamide-nucleotide amidase [Novosphingobium sp. BK349]MBB3620033.1 nicotinamide-nucleotide amidase [Novosphingobium sp. BK592]MBB3651488.1 nicotinamide-nucleotide amidase [Novosphingobium sp. BK626]NO
MPSPASPGPASPSHASSPGRDVQHGCLGDAAPLLVAAQRVLALAAEHDAAIATAESCTGGLLASLLTDIEGYGRWFDRGFVTYSAQAKSEMLGIDLVELRRHDPVSRAIAEAMARGALAHSRAGLVAAITGNAGTGGPRDEPGLAHIAVLRRDGGLLLRECHYGARPRDAVRLHLAGAALAMMADALNAARG